MRALAKIICAVALAGLAGGCQPGESFGYVQIKRLFNPSAGDVFRLNGQTLEALKRSFDIVVKQKAGAAKIELDRGGSLATLCAFDLGKNRIVTATIAVDNGRIKCVVQS